MNKLTIGLLFSALVSFNALAVPSDALILQYNQAADGDEGAVAAVYQQLENHIESQGVDALTLVYLGSTETLKGRDALMPWNKMKYTEQGLATIAKGLDLLNHQPVPIQQQQRRQGLPESLLAKSIAAATFTSLPDMFNHFERGYDLYLDLLADKTFQQQDYVSTSWVYLYAIKAALRAEDVPQAKRWLETMQANSQQHPLTLQAQAMIHNAT